MAFSAIMLSSCGTVQSIVHNTSPYSTNILISSGIEANQEYETLSSANSFSQYLGAGTDKVQNVRVVSAKATASNHSMNPDLGIFKSIKVYLSGNNTYEVLIAERTDIGNNIGETINLDPDTLQALDDIVKSGSVKARIVYVLKNKANNDTNLTITMKFKSDPVKVSK